MMKFSTTLATALLAGSAIAAPTLQEKLEARMKQRREERWAAKQALGRQGKTLRPLAPDTSDMSDFIQVGIETSEVTYSSNWYVDITKVKRKPLPN